MRFNTLDGLRGVAAVLVLFYHLGPAAPIAAPGGYLAVDLFFALSGFVIAHAYDTRLREGMSLREFAMLRLIRIYPMAFVGAAIGVVLAQDFVPSLILLPNFDLGDVGSQGAGALYPTNVALWSLVLELLVNLAFAAVTVRVGWRSLAIILAVSAIILMTASLDNRICDLGVFWDTLGHGFARTIFSFTLGVAIRRLHDVYLIERRETPLAWLLPIAIALLLTQIPPHDRAWDLAFIFVLMPAILCLATIWETPGTRVCEWLAAMSYPLYCIHGVVVQAVSAVRPTPDYLWILLILAAWWLNSRIDVPLRRGLLAALSRRGSLRPA